MFGQVRLRAMNRKLWTLHPDLEFCVLYFYQNLILRCISTRVHWRNIHLCEKAKIIICKKKLLWISVVPRYSLEISSDTLIPFLQYRSKNYYQCIIPHILDKKTTKYGSAASQRRFFMHALWKRKKAGMNEASSDVCLRYCTLFAIFFGIALICNILW